MSEDPIGFTGGDYNLYRYCGNSHTNGTDPSGNIAPLIVVAGLAIAGLSTANVAYRVETAQYQAGFDAAARNDWQEFNRRYENGQYAQAVGNIGVTVAATAPFAYFGGAGLSILGRAATNMGGAYLVTYNTGMIGMGIVGTGAAGYSAYNMALATPYMSGPERLNAWGCFGSSLAVGLPLGIAGFRAGPNMAMAAMESNLGISALRMLGTNRAAGLMVALGPEDNMVACLMYSAVRNNLSNVGKGGYSTPAHAGAARDPIMGNIAARNNQSPLLPLKTIRESVFQRTGSSRIANKVINEIKAMCEPFGGYGTKYPLRNGQTYTVGNCWEFKAFVALKILNPQLTPQQVMFTQSLRLPKSGIPTPLTSCDICKGMYPNANTPFPYYYW